MERIPILKMGRFLLVTIQVDMHDRLAMDLQEDLMSQISKTRARGVLIEPPTERAGRGHKPGDHRFAVAGQILPQRRLQFFPHRPGLLGEYRIGENVPLHSLALGPHLGVVGEIIDQFLNQCVGLLAPRMVGVAHFP